MRDKRPVDELTIEELERILAIKRREQRQQQLQRMKRSGRVVDAKEKAPAPVARTPLPITSTPVPSNHQTVQSVSTASPLPRDAAPRFEDEMDDVIDIDYEDVPEDDRAWKMFMNRSLLLVEILAVVGLIFLGVNLFDAIGALERESASAQELADQLRRDGIPTLAPTPQLRLANFVLPSGHTPPEPGGRGGQFNFAEVPAHLLPLVESEVIQPPISRPVQTEETALQLIIPKLNINNAIIQGTDWEALKQGIGQVQNGTDPTNDGGNLVLAAHNDIYNELFRYLDQLEEGDRFQIQTRTQLFTYVVRGWEVVEPSAVHVMENTDSPTATLISCYPYQVDNKRIVVFADRVEV